MLYEVMKLTGVGLVDIMFLQSLPKARRGRGCLISEDEERGVKTISQKNRPMPQSPVKNGDSEEKSKTPKPKTSFKLIFHQPTPCNT